mmetsp:Transcript_11143/g.25808  ORF Transcript_11143/g.25808 Transcript_11143/m.25808 type:complete len:294 (+) Transcript_11143:202-1083(+)
MKGAVSTESGNSHPPISLSTKICHQLRSAPHGGDMSFQEISEVVPWLELAFDQGQDLNGPQYGDEEGIPRVFKSHAWEGHCPKGAKMIVVLRDPADVLVSFYKFFENWFFEEGTISLDEFARHFWLARGVPSSRMNNASYFVHLISWFRRRKEYDNILIVCFEDMKQNLRREVERVARFISTDKHDFTKEEYVRLATERSTFAYMMKHRGRFDEKLSKSARNEACGLPRDAGIGSGKLRQGHVGRGKESLSPAIRDEIQQKWREVVEPVTGCATYTDLVDLLHKEREAAAVEP